MIKKIALFIALSLFALLTLILYRAYNFTPAPAATLTAEALAPQQNELLPSPEVIATHLSQAIQFRTISHEQKASSASTEFTAFIDWLAKTYPLLHQQFSLQRLNDYTLLYKWQGKQSDRAVLLSAHYDVVPVTGESDWTYPPFDGMIAEDYIWGRGALDDKSAAIALMEAATLLLSSGFQPEQDIYIALTHDEEIGSQNGARAVAEQLRSNAVNVAWSLDEGSFVLDGMIPGITTPVASINVAEKGYLTLELVAHGQGGHSSMPPQETAVSILAAAIVKLKENPVPGGLEGLSKEMYLNLGKHMDFGKRILFANTWLFKPVIESVMGSLPSGNAMLRTTTAPTMLSGSVKANVLPTIATAKVNFRLHPRDSVASLTEWVRTVIDDDRIDINAIQPAEASAISSSTEQGFIQIAQQARRVHGDVIVVPGLTIAATDSRYYGQITNAYRFNPMVIDNQDLAGFHGINERISIDNMTKAVSFYIGLMRSQ
tara:strand:+ start:4641 stop:6104 length:1464 start_codon:yes stop_codon:yes gene_type:complete